MTSAAIVSIRVNADPARAFEMFTSEIAAWWRPSPLFELTPRGDGRLRFEPGPQGRLVSDLDTGKSYEIGRITDWAPGERLGFTWRPAALDPSLATRVEVRFEPVGEQTRVTVAHYGWAEIPPDHVLRHGFPAAVFLHRAGEWWRASLGRLAASA